jgi:hypothetical protein
MSTMRDKTWTAMIGGRLSLHDALRDADAGEELANGLPNFRRHVPREKLNHERVDGRKVPRELQASREQELVETTRAISPLFRRSDRDRAQSPRRRESKPRCSSLAYHLEACCSLAERQDPDCKQA